MTDPVDTDTLRAALTAAARVIEDAIGWARHEGAFGCDEQEVVGAALAQASAAADEVDRLRNAVHEYSKQLSDAGAAESRAYAERDRLRGVTENAPHAAECEQWDLEPRTGRALSDHCTCWKAEAL